MNALPPDFLAGVFVRLTPPNDMPWGWPGISPLARTCKVAAEARRVAIQELTPDCNRALAEENNSPDTRRPTKNNRGP